MRLKVSGHLVARAQRLGTEVFTQNGWSHEASNIFGEARYFPNGGECSPCASSGCDAVKHDVNSYTNRKPTHGVVAFVYVVASQPFTRMVLNPELQSRL